MRHHRDLRREPLHVLRLLLEEPSRDEHREVKVLVPGRLDAVVDLPLDGLPDREAVRLDHHGPSDEGVLGEPRLLHDLLVPGGEIVGLLRKRHGPTG